MLKPRYVAATALAIACGAIPLAQGASAPAPASSYYVKVAYGDHGRVVAVDVVRVLAGTRAAVRFALRGPLLHVPESVCWKRTKSSACLPVIRWYPGWRSMFA